GRPVLAAELRRPVVETTGRRVARADFRHREADDDDHDSDERPADVHVDRAAVEHGDAVRGQAPRQDRDDRERDSEVGEAPHPPQQFLGVPEPMESLGIAVNSLNGHRLISPCGPVRWAHSSSGSAPRSTDLSNKPNPVKTVRIVSMPEFLVGELVRQRMGALSASERRLAQVLLAFYPVAGLENLTRFAERAGVSPATVTRFIAKLGLRGYPEFQDSLRQELQERLSSPLARYERARPGGLTRSVLRDAFETYEHSLRASIDMVSEHDFDAVIDLLSDSRRHVLTLGGRGRTFLARYLASQLHLIRPGVELNDPERSNPADRLVDLGRRDILVVFDYRRYQSDTINSAKVAAGRGGTVVLVTDA